MTESGDNPLDQFDLPEDSQAVKRGSAPKFKRRRFIVHTKMADDVAKSARAHGVDIGVIDPRVDPERYQWNISGEEVWLYQLEVQDRQYVEHLAMVLLQEGAETVKVRAPKRFLRLFSKETEH